MNNEKFTRKEKPRKDVGKEGNKGVNLN